MVPKHLELFCRHGEGILKILEMQAGKALECYKQSLISYSGGSSEYQDADKVVDSKDSGGFRRGELYWKLD